jgi:outer membrane protein assembly factor BamB
MLGLAWLGAQASPPARAQVRSEFVPTFSTSSRVKQQVERLGRLATQKQWDEWLAAYQQLVTDGAEQVLERDDEFLVGVRHHAHQLLAAQPATVRTRYRALFDAEAAKLYDRAAAERDAVGMREVYSRYRFSSAAPRALLWIANRSLDEGRPEVARVAYRRLAKEAGANAGLLLRYALASAAAGKPDEATEVLGRVRKEFAGGQATVGGEALSVAVAADRVAATLRAVPAERRAILPVPSFAGAGGDRTTRSLPAVEGKPLWQYRLPPGGATTRVIARGSYGLGRSRFSFLTFPVVGTDRVWVQSPRGIAAVSMATGERLWNAGDFTLPPGEIPAINSNPRNGGAYYPRPRAIQAAPSLDGNRLVTRIPLAQGDTDSVNWPADFAIVAMDASTGKSLWRRTAGGEPRGLFYNIPTSRANTVFTGMAVHKGGITEYTAVALDGGTGETLWSTYLGAGSDPVGIVDGSPAAVVDGVVWIESTLYTLNALDLVTGEIRLIYRYKPGRRDTIRGGFSATPAISNEPISLVAAGEGKPLVFAPRWGTDVVALDPASGKLLWSSPKAPGQSTIGSLFAVDKTHAYICGEHVQALNLTDGARDWTVELEGASGDIGYAALAGDRIYIAVNGRIYVRQASDGKEVDVLNPAAGLGEEVGFTSLVAGGGMLFLSTNDRVLAFGPATAPAQKPAPGASSAAPTSFESVLTTSVR